MNILIICSGYNQKVSSGNLVTRKIANALRENNNRVYIYAFQEHIVNASNNKKDIIILNTPFKLSNYNLIGRFWGRIVSNFKGNTMVNEYYIRPAVKLAKEFVQKYHIELIISICFPIESHIIASRIIKKDVKWIAMYYDPFYANGQFKANKRQKRMEMEKRILIKTDAIMLLPSIKRDFEKDKLFLNKIHSFNLPVSENICIENGSTIILNKEKINCVFAGTLYYDIRNPEYMLKCFEALSGVRLYLIGSHVGNFEPMYFEKWKDKRPDTIKIWNRKDVTTINGIIFQADILVNIGNNVSNQIPGKIFDYMLTGKPIINFYKVEACPTLEILDEYPLTLNIFEKEMDCMTACKKIQEFIFENYKQRVDQNVINNIKKKYSTQNIVDTMLKCAQKN